MDDIQSLLPFVFMVATTLAAGLAYFRASYAKATIDTLKDSNAALTERVSLLEKDVADAKASEKIAVNENLLLRSLIPSEDVLNHMINLQEGWAAQLSEEHQQIISVIHQLMDHLKVAQRPSNTRTRRTDANA